MPRPPALIAKFQPPKRSNALKLKPLTAVKKLSEINLDPKHPRQFSRKQIRDAARQAEVFGALDHPVIDKYGNVLRGQELVQAYIALGLDEITVIVADYLTAEEALAYSLASARMAEKATWDEGKLAARFQELMTFNLPFPIEITGFEMPEIDVLLHRQNKLTNPDRADEFALPTTPVISALGDLWSLGRHRIYCGSALVSHAYDRLLQGERARVVVSDPPFNVPISGHVRVKDGHREFAMASGEMTPDQFRQFLRDCVGYMADNLLDGGLLYLFMDWRHVHDLISAGLDNALVYLNLCVWDKGHGAMGSLYRSRHELVTVFRNGPTPHINNVQLGRYGRNRSNVWYSPGANGFRHKDSIDDFDLHPTVKPVGLLADATLP